MVGGGGSGQRRKGERMERYYTVSEISERTGIPRRTLYDAINAGRLAALVPSGCRRGWRVSESAWSEFVKANTRRG